MSERCPTCRKVCMISADLRQRQEASTRHSPTTSSCILLSNHIPLITGMSVSSIDLQGIDVLSDSLSFLGDDYQSMFDDGIVRSALFVPRADQLLTEMQIWRARTEHSTQGMLLTLIISPSLTIHRPLRQSFVGICLETLHRKARCVLRSDGLRCLHLAAHRA